MFCFNEVVQANVIQFIPNASDIDTEGIVINVELIIPKKIHHIISGTNFTGTLKEIVKNFQFVFCQYKSNGSLIRSKTDYYQAIGG